MSSSRFLTLSSMTWHYFPFLMIPHKLLSDHTHSYSGGTASLPASTTWATKNVMESAQPFPRLPLFFSTHFSPPISVWLQAWCCPRALQTASIRTKWKSFYVKSRSTQRSPGPSESHSNINCALLPQTASSVGTSAGYHHPSQANHRLHHWDRAFMTTAVNAHMVGNRLIWSGT